MNRIIKQKLHIEPKLKELKPYLKDHFHVSSIGYFGSFAKGNAGENSDVDLLVEFSETPGWEYVQLKFFLEKELRRPVDIVTNGALKEQLKESILNEVKYV
jgi:predicted nucleotidyltransferase